MSLEGTLSPSVPTGCPYTVNATVSGNVMTGTYATFNCKVVGRWIGHADEAIEADALATLVESVVTDGGLRWLLSRRVRPDNRWRQGAFVLVGGY